MCGHNENSFSPPGTRSNVSPKLTDGSFRKARLLRAFLRFLSMFISVPFVLGLTIGLAFTTQYFVDSITTFEHSFTCVSHAK